MPRSKRTQCAPRKPGRPSKLTPALQAQIVEAIRAGNYAEVAARHVGIASSTFYDWMKRGANGERRFSEFADAISEAEAFAQARAVTIIANAMAVDWRAAAFFLERKFQEQWGRHDRTDVTMTTKRDEDLERRLLKGRELNAKGLKA